MPRETKQSDFPVEVDGVGSLNFARRSMGDVYKIRGMYAQLTAGNYDEEGRPADFSALGYVSIKVLLVEGPKSFNVETMDPLLDDDFDKKIVKVFTALRVKELSFRPKPTQSGKDARAGHGEQLQPLVSGEVPPGANGSEIPGSDA